MHLGEDFCPHCDELKGLHRGEETVARGHTWPSRIVARALEQLSLGASYADTSRWAVEAAGVRRTRTTPSDSLVEDGSDDLADDPFLVEAPDDPTDADGTEPARRKRKVSAASKAARNRWHIAADWVEVFSPVLYGPLEERLRREAQQERERLDALLAAGKPPDRPQVVLLDDVPVYARDLTRGKKKARRRDFGYFILVAAELDWGDGAATPETKLRLARPMPKSNTPAWRLLLDELGYAPDFVVADAGTGIGAALRAQYKSGHTRFVPSLWHLTQQLERALARTKPARGSDGPPPVITPLHDHLRKLSRSSGVLAGAAPWKAWWDELFEIAAANGLPTDTLVERRKRYEPPYLDVLDDLAAHPGVPVSTGGLETLITRYVAPMLARRRSSFGNLERTNRLFDLVIARQHGVFTDLNDVARQLRDDARSNNGLAVPLRYISDPQADKTTLYSSLRDPVLLNDLATKRGLR